MKNPETILKRSTAPGLFLKIKSYLDLLSPAATKISEKEYRVQKRGQKNLDKINDQIKKEGMKPQVSVFQTQKQYLLDAIDAVSVRAKDYEGFRNLLFDEYQITVTERRGRYSYLYPERNKNITGRVLGSHYEKDYLIRQFGTEIEKPSNDKSADIPLSDQPEKTAPDEYSGRF